MDPHWMCQPVGCEVFLDGPLVQDEVNRNSTRGLAVQVTNHSIVGQSVCHYGNNLQSEQLQN